MAEGPIRRDGARIRAHHVSQVRRAGVAAFGDHAKERVALGKNAGKAPLLHHEQRADTLFLHQASRLRDRHLSARAHGSLARHQLAYGSLRHGVTSSPHTLHSRAAMKNPFAALLVASAVHAAEPLPALHASPEGVTVSGVSSGGYMAVQFQVAYSARVTGVGVI